jgi:hypothetical protein
MTMNLSRRILPAMLLLPAAAMAQQPARRGPNGGPVVTADGHPIELVLSGTTLTLFVSEENGRPMSSARANGRVTVQAAGQTATVTLAPAEPNRLVGTLAAPLAPGARVVFTGTLSDGHRVTARYVVD